MENLKNLRPGNVLKKFILDMKGAFLIYAKTQYVCFPGYRIRSKDCLSFTWYLGYSLTKYPIAHKLNICTLILGLNYEYMFTGVTPGTSFKRCIGLLSFLIKLNWLWQIMKKILIGHRLWLFTPIWALMWPFLIPLK